MKLRKRPSGRQNRKQTAENEEEEEEESDDIMTFPLRRHANRRRPEELGEEDEDSMLEELGGVEDEDEPRKRRTRGRQDNSARSKRLEGLAKLKQRRAGITEISGDDEEQQEEEGPDEEGSEIYDDEPSAEEERPSKTLDDYDSDFVEDDGEIGVDLMKHGVPLKFTGHANKKPFDYFKDEVEWYVLHSLHAKL